MNNPLNPFGGGREFNPADFTGEAEEAREEEIRERIAWVQRGGWGVNLLTALGAIILVLIVVSILLRLVG